MTVEAEGSNADTKIMETEAYTVNEQKIWEKPEWVAARDSVRAALEAGATLDEARAIAVHQLNLAGLDIATVLKPNGNQGMPESPINGWLDKSIDGIDLSVLASRFIVEWAKGGEPAAALASALAGVGETQIAFAGEPSQMVVALAGPLTEPEELAIDLIARCYQAFPPANLKHSSKLSEQARVWEELRSIGSYEKLAKKNLRETKPALDPDGPGFDPELAKEIRRLRASRKAFLQYVRDVLEAVSRD